VPRLEPEVPLFLMLGAFASIAGNSLGLSMIAFIEMDRWIEGLRALTPLYGALLSHSHRAQEAVHAEEGA